MTVIPEWAYRGNEVACIRTPDGSRVWGAPAQTGSVYPQKGKTYVIAEVETYRRHVFITVQEIDPMLVWDVRYFRPLIKGKLETDIAIFKKIADDAPPIQLDLLQDEPA